MSAKPAERLEKTLARVAREQGLDQERLRRWVSFLALCGVLEQAMEQGVIDSYYLKGGVAMELRFARAARTTKDFDLGLEGNRTELLRRLGDVLQLGFDAFTFRLKPEIHEMELADTVRVAVTTTCSSSLLSAHGGRTAEILGQSPAASDPSARKRNHRPRRFRRHPSSSERRRFLLSTRSRLGPLFQ